MRSPRFKQAPYVPILVKAVYDEKAFLCYMDTDSFIYDVETENIYDDMIKNADLFDFSNYSW